MPVKQFLDMGRYVKVLSDEVEKAVAADVAENARHFVAVDTFELHDSIDVDGNIAFSLTPYNKAQEWGRPDIPAYTWTPYMRPAARKSGKDISRPVRVADTIALRKARV